VAIEAAAQSGDDFQYAALEGRLDEKHREWLSKLLFARDRQRGSIEDGRNAIQALVRQSWEKQYRGVMRDIAEAEQSGDRTKAIDLLRKKRELEASRESVSQSMT
jgi:hypothetical protein